MTQHQYIEVGITEQELQELMDGKTFEWNYDNAVVKLFKEE